MQVMIQTIKGTIKAFNIYIIDIIMLGALRKTYSIKTSNCFYIIRSLTERKNIEKLIFYRKNN